MSNGIVAHIVEIPNNTRRPLTDAEMATLPAEGLPLIADDLVIGKCPPGGVIRQGRNHWWWHPSEAHAEAAARARKERAFIVGNGVAREVQAETPERVL